MARDCKHMQMTSAEHVSVLVPKARPKLPLLIHAFHIPWLIHVFRVICTLFGNSCFGLAHSHSHQESSKISWNLIIHSIAWLCINIPWGRKSFRHYVTFILTFLHIWSILNLNNIRCNLIISKNKTKKTIHQYANIV